MPASPQLQGFDDGVLLVLGLIIHVVVEIVVQAAVGEVQRAHGGAGT